ncbi:MAG: hypothetical protein HYY09_04360 [Firmicutes bacterium]|nr:hypothetical protein [Bacillota bacterium]
MVEPLDLAVNYWSREAGVQMWRDWPEDSITADLAGMKALGIRTVRFFLLWPDFQPEPFRLDEIALQRLGRFLDLCSRHGLSACPTFFTGHMSGENWDVPWRRGADPYTDPFLLRAQAYQVRRIASLFGGHPAVACWDLGNEPDLVARPRHADDAESWAAFLKGEIRAAGGRQPLTVGIHFPSLAGDNGFHADGMGRVCDLVSMHAYPFYTPLCPGPVDSFRSTLLLPFACRLTAALSGKPVHFSEFGLTASWVSEATEGSFMAAALASLFMAGAAGAGAWCWGDFRRPARPPYNSAPFEASFGLVRADGEPRPSALVWRDFSRALAALGVPSGLGVPAALEAPSALSEAPVRPPALPALPAPLPAGGPRTGILAPRRYYEALEIDPGEFAAAAFGAFTLASGAGLDPCFVPPGAPFEDYDLLIAPSIRERGHLYHEDWERLAVFVRKGGTLLCSYNGVAWTGAEELFGYRVESPRRCDVERDSLRSSRNVTAASGAGNGAGIGAAAGVRIADGPEEVRSGDISGDLTGLQGERLLLVRPDAAETLAEGERMVFLKNRFGNGTAFFLNAPWERVLVRDPGPFPAEAHLLPYRIAAASAAAASPKHNGPTLWTSWNVRAGLRKCPDGLALVAVNHHPVSGSLEFLPGPAGLAGAEELFRHGRVEVTSSQRLELGPSAVWIARLNTAG